MSYTPEYYEGYIKKQTVMDLLESYKEDCHRFSNAFEEFNECREEIKRWDTIDLDKIRRETARATAKDILEDIWNIPHIYARLQPWVDQVAEEYGL